MKIHGQVFDITNLPKFALSYLKNKKAPDATSFHGARDLRVGLAVANPLFAQLTFLPNTSAWSTASIDGQFEFNVSDQQKVGITACGGAYLVVYRRTGTMKAAGQSIPIYECIYRSAVFQLADAGVSAPLKIYVGNQDVSASAAITQTMIDSQVKSALHGKLPKGVSLTTTIENGGVAVSGGGYGASISFKIELTTDTSPDLASYIRGSAKGMDIDFPGPDFILGACFSKKDIAKLIDIVIANIMQSTNKTISSELVKAVAAATGQSEAAIKVILANEVSLTFRKLDYPSGAPRKFKIGTQTFSVPTTTVLPRPTLGFPRNPVKENVSSSSSAVKRKRVPVPPRR